MEDFIGQSLRDYRIVERIGSGGYGVIYKAFQPSVNREVAIKIIHPDLLGEAEFVQRFEIEAQLIARLEHPHIVPLYDFWHDDKGLFLVMRYLRGGSLRSAIKQQGALSLAFVMRIVDQIADALTEAHNAGIVHRDIKPDNILLDNRGNAYLTDFGIARNLEVETHITDSEHLVGSPAYVSPEQIKAEDINCQSDIYNFGIVLYELLTGKHPFAGATLGVMLSQHLHQAIPLIRNTRPDLPLMLDTVIQRATRKEPRERYPDMLSLAVDFRSAIEHQQNDQLLSIPEPVPEISAHPETDIGTPINSEYVRYRSRLINNIDKFWIKSVLEKSFYGPSLVNLKMEYVKGAVEPPLHLRKQFPNTLSETTGILDVFDIFNGKLLILGDPGSGKTTRLLELARALISRAKSDNVQAIPVVLNLSSWAARRKPLEKWIVSELTEKYEVARHVARTWIRKDMLALLLDGLDEVSESWQEACINAINQFRQQHLLADIVVCSRIQEYNNLTNKLNLNGAIFVKPLEDSQIEAYLLSNGSKANLLGLALREDNALREMSRSPLLLNILIQVYQNGLELPSTTQHKEAREHLLRKHLFRKYIEYMVHQRAEKLSGEPPYSEEDTIRYLSTLAWQIMATTQTIFYVDQLSPLWLRTDLQVLMFRILAMIASALLLNSTLFCTLAFILTFRLDQVAWLVPFKLFIDALALAAHIRDPFKMHSKSPSGKHTLRTRIYSFIRHYWLGCIVGGATALMFAQWNNSAFVLLSVLSGIVTGVVTQSLYFQQGQDYVASNTLRFVMFVTGQIPLELKAFLDYAVSINMLRKVGEGYIFIHRYLLEYFADLRRESYPNEQVVSRPA